MKEAIVNRPTETASGAALGLAVYGFATQVGVPPEFAGPAAVVVAFGPAVVSSFVDVFRRR